LPSLALLLARTAVLLAAALPGVALIAGAAALAASANYSGERTNSTREDPVDLAARYEHGESVRVNYGRALALYCEAARAGDPRAFFSLGWMYLNGRGVPRNDAIAVMWLRKAAKHGIPQAAHLLSVLPKTPAAAAQGCPTGNLPAAVLAAPPPALRSLIDETAREVGIDRRLLLTVMFVESRFNPQARSPKMAAGLMQLMPETAARFGVEDVFDERANIRAGAIYLKSLLEMFKGDLTLALSAYNAGEAAVLTHGGVPPYRETIDYVATVKRLCACGQ
jgi:soluble lytic murein transglycosylase-like protein